MANLADMAKSKTPKPDNLSWMYRIASFTVAKYWRDYYYAINGIDCGHCSNPQRKKCKAGNLYSECPRAIKIENLNKPIVDEDGHITELGEVVADDNAIDLDAWLDAKTFLLGCPERLIDIAVKRRDGIPLSHADRIYWSKWQKKSQKRLPV